MIRRRQRRPPTTSIGRPVGPILTAAREEAAWAGHGYVGVEHLLIALARTDSGLLAEHAVTPASARLAVRQVVAAGDGDGPRWDAEALLGTLGIDLAQIRRQVEESFGPDAVHQLYSGPVGWNLRPRGPLCDPPMTPQLKRALHRALGRCWDASPSRLSDRLLLGALDADSAGLTSVLTRLGVEPGRLRAAVRLD
ncbi:Clp protease N-terminal domain-containing protein [Cryptosporangium aurantiacum]|uniref:Clp amino terminal domain-containing protein, pathogenicity island component n=1 Tax=Cryptosporangium aurantiacum TaxID=134849 RepID=A0A1M7RPL4_9ACTN|nr:Clp protease N-terminal domain-containing protein [Cryptosporangium aurantiacum]SHN48169.1 Clp amino terminal domain-containing protein, pathogenicity island component [Cryptosporangium aurantiacum]